jgi:hypothetical protein
MDDQRKYGRNSAARHTERDELVFVPAPVAPLNARLEICKIAEARGLLPGFGLGSVQVAEQINATTEYNDRRYGPK